MKQHPDLALREAITIAGGMRALGRSLNLSHQAIQRWPRAPAERVITIERITGIPRQTLRPDLYPDEAAIAAKPRIPLSAGSAARSHAARLGTRRL